MNKLGKKGQAFLFIIDFAMQRPLVLPLSKVNPKEILYEINGVTNAPKVKPLRKAIFFEKYPLAFAEYASKFDFVKNQIQIGNSFLVNLTCPTPITTNLSLKEIFYHSQARYKLYFRDQFVVFSPEIFVQIRNNQIASFPMKGTIDAAIPNAKTIIINNKKETAEHYTIVDLIRNDLSMVAQNVQVKRLRYIEQVHTNEKNLLQVSSEVVGDLESNWQERLGDIMFRLLPAGSISGAPKPKTIDIIREAEQYERGYYTGVFGVFDGKNVDCGVMIRFIEKTPQGLLYKSGGGITGFSEASSEYQEMIDKVYLPIQNKQVRSHSNSMSLHS
ncbi:MAG: aminodeoxychorismate synthase component I [Saprospiraceae bacterium]|nr:aminodeoxychorismate synthase component I [Saprospiraceae bacterium]